MAYKDFYQLMLECFKQPVDLFTISQDKPFKMYVENESLYLKNSADNIHKIRPKDVAAFIQRFEEKESFLPKDYHDITRKSSYLLSVIKYITEKDSSNFSIFSPHNEESDASEKESHV